MCSIVISVILFTTRQKMTQAVKKKHWATSNCTGEMNTVDAEINIAAQY